jgi:hypothetical protein
MSEAENEFVALTNKAFGPKVRPAHDFYPDIALPADLQDECMEAYMRGDWRTACLLTDIASCYKTVWENGSVKDILVKPDRLKYLYEILSQTRSRAAQIWMYGVHDGT